MNKFIGDVLDDFVEVAVALVDRGVDEEYALMHTPTILDLAYRKEFLASDSRDQ